MSGTARGVRDDGRLSSHFDRSEKKCRAMRTNATATQGGGVLTAMAAATIWNVQG